MAWITEQDDGCMLNVRVIPRATQTKIDGVLGDALKIRLQAPPVDGKANKELLRFLKKILRVPAHAVFLETGASGRHKRIRIIGLSADRIRGRLRIDRL